MIDVSELILFSLCQDAAILKTALLALPFRTMNSSTPSRNHARLHTKIASKWMNIHLLAIVFNYEY